MDILTQESKDEIIYATIGRRIKASIFDSVILLFLFVIIPVIVGQFVQSPLGALRALVMFAPIFIFEPLLVSYWGQTVGQYFLGIKVVREVGMSKCPLLLSFARYYTKAILGLWSVLYILFSKKHKAIHDYLAHTVVILSPSRLANNPLFAESGITEQEQEKDFLYPSALRRFVFFVIWWLVASIVLDKIVNGLLSLVVGTDRAAQLIKSGDPFMTFILLILMFVAASLSAKGLLPGARRLSNTDDSIAMNTEK